MSQSMANDELERVVDFIERMAKDGVGLGDPAERMPWLAVKEDYDYDYPENGRSTATTTTTSSSAFVKAGVSEEGKESDRKSLLSQARGEDQKAPTASAKKEEAKSKSKSKNKKAASRRNEEPSKENTTGAGKKKVQMRVAEQKPRPQGKAKPEEVKRKAEDAKAGEVVANLKAELSGPAEDQKKSWLGLF